MNTTPTTQPSEGAVRAAKALELAYGLNPLGNELNDIAALIDRETGAGELVAACSAVLKAYPPSQYRRKHLPPALESQIRAALSRHISTQGKEGKL